MRQARKRMQKAKKKVGEGMTDWDVDCPYANECSDKEIKCNSCRHNKDRIGNNMTDFENFIAICIAIVCGTFFGAFVCGLFL